MRDDRVVMSRSLQQKVVKMAHSIHPGTVKTKKLLRETLWFSCLDNLTEKMISACLHCQASNTQAKPNREPLCVFITISSLE